MTRLPVVGAVGVDDELGTWTGSSYDGWPVTMGYDVAHEGDGGVVVSEGAYQEGRRYNVGEDDRQGVRSTYPDATNPGFDVALQSYETPDINAELGLCDAFHARQAPSYDFAAAVAEGAEFDECPGLRLLPPDVYHIYQGAPFDAHFTLHNNGDAGLERVEVEFTMESGDGGADRTLGRRAYDLGVDRPYEWQGTFTMPVDLVPGDCFLRAEMDPDDLLIEVEEDPDVGVEYNNIAYYDVPIVVIGLPACNGCAQAPRRCFPTAVIAGLLLFARRRRA